MILRIQCPACERQFKVGDELMGRMVECGACEHRFRFNKETVVPHREKFYPGDLRRPGLEGAARVPLDSQQPVQFQAVKYETWATAADVIPLSPQRKVSIMVGVGVVLFGSLIFLWGSELGGVLQDISQSKRLVMGCFMAMIGGGLVAWGTRWRKSGWFSAGILAAILITLSLLMPVHYSQGPESTREFLREPQPESNGRLEITRKSMRPTAQEMMDLIGFGPVKKAVATYTTASRDGRERVAAIWVPGMEERFKFQIQKYLQRILGTKERPSFLNRREGGLFVVEGIEVAFEEVVGVVDNFGSVDEVYPEIRLMVVTIDGERLLEASPELERKLTDKTHPAFYVRNLQELSHIDIDRVQEAARRLADAEPKRFRKEITRRLTSLIEEEAEVEYKGAFTRALGVWSEPGDGTEVVVEKALSEAVDRGEPPPRSMVNFVVQRKSPTAAALVERLWSQDPQTWESVMMDLGPVSEEAAVRKLSSDDKGLRYSAVNVLKRVGTDQSLPSLRSSLAEANQDLRVLLQEAIGLIEGRR